MNNINSLRFSSLFTLSCKNDMATLEALKKELGNKQGIKLYPEGMPDSENMAYTIHTLEPGEICGISKEQYIKNNQHVISTLYDKLQIAYSKNDNFVSPVDKQQRIKDRMESKAALEELIKNFANNESSIDMSNVVIYENGSIEGDLNIGGQQFKYFEGPLDAQKSKKIEIHGNGHEKLIVEFGRQAGKDLKNDLYYIMSYTNPDDKTISFSSVVKHSDLENLKNAAKPSQSLAKLKPNFESAYDIAYTAFTLVLKIINSTPEIDENMQNS